MDIIYLSLSSTDQVELANALEANDIEFRRPQFNLATPTSPEALIEIISVVGNATFWAALASVLVSFIKSRRQRKIIITLKSGETIHAEGFSVQEFEEIISKAKNIKITRKK